MDSELRQLRRQAETGGSKEQIIYLLTMLRGLSPLIKNTAPILQSVENGNAPWEAAESILQIEDNTSENREIISTFFYQYLRQIPICRCENSHCNFCQGGNCVQFANENTWIQYLGHFCSGCALEMPIQYHGYFPSSHEYLEMRYRVEDSFPALRICQCSMCKQIRSKVEFILHLKAPYLSIEYINPMMMNSSEKQFQEIQIGTRIPHNWMRQIVPQSSSNYNRVISDHIIVTMPQLGDMGIIYLSSIAEKEFNTSIILNPAVIILNKHNSGNSTIWENIKLS